MSEPDGVGLLEPDGVGVGLLEPDGVGVGLLEPSIPAIRPGLIFKPGLILMPEPDGVGVGLLEPNIPDNRPGLILVRPGLILMGPPSTAAIVSKRTINTIILVFIKTLFNE